jgi:hypothetical protein
MGWNKTPESSTVSIQVVSSSSFFFFCLSHLGGFSTVSLYANVTCFSSLYDEFKLFRFDGDMAARQYFERTNPRYFLASLFVNGEFSAKRDA